MLIGAIGDFLPFGWSNFIDLFFSSLMFQLAFVIVSWAIAEIVLRTHFVDGSSGLTLNAVQMFLIGFVCISAMLVVTWVVG
jgi:hypothetical protein